MDIKERMARQMHRVKVEAAIAAMKIPPPDYVFKEPQMPKPMSEKQKVQAFIEDRTYDDIPMDQSKIDPKRVTSMADVHRIIISEQPREFVIGPKEQLNHKAPNFRNIGQEAIEGPGYSAFTLVVASVRLLLPLRRPLRLNRPLRLLSLTRNRLRPI